MHLPLLEQVLIVLAASLPVSIIARRLGQSTVVGFLVTGLVIGPSGLGWIGGGDIQSLAELGVGLLLFAIGIELSPAQIARTMRLAVVGGVLELALCGCAAGLVAFAISGRGLEAGYLGCAAALSSTAIILKTLSEKGELDSPHAAGAVAISIVQDLSTVPMLVILPVLGAGAAGGAALGGSILLALGKAVAVLAGMWIGSRFVVGPLLYHVARLRSPEVFLVTVIVLVLAAGFGAAAMGLPLALGAFCAGLL
ncbi:MAG: cation:proton antiporter, partial [Polyangiaceae bacterium]